MNAATVNEAISARKKFIAPVMVPICAARHRILQRNHADRKCRAEAEREYRQQHQQPHSGNV